MFYICANSERGMLKKGFIYLVGLVLGLTVSAQNVEETSTVKKTWKDAPTIEKQYKAFKGSLRKYQKFTYFEDATMDEYYKSYSDTIVSLKGVLSTTEKKGVELKAEVESLKKQKAEVEANLVISEEEGGTLPVLGARADKVTFATVMWVIVFVLIAVCAFVFFLFKRSHVVTKQAKQDFSDLHDEFEEHRKNTLERERKLRRELQDYINKIEDLKIKGRV